MGTLGSQLAAFLCAITLAASATAWAQTGPRARSGAATANSDQTLEIAPRAVSPPPAPVEAPPVEQSAPPIPTSGPPASVTTPHDLGVESRRPYLGISAQYVETHATPGHNVQGIEVVGVDPGSPAQKAGLRGRGRMTDLGATGATAGALMPPLDLVVMPLLKKSGQLGGTGDLIVAIDDKRVLGEDALENALAAAKPGDILYFTVKRLRRDGSEQTLKLPVKLGRPRQSARD
jgi:hypothetical protein